MKSKNIGQYRGQDLGRWEIERNIIERTSYAQVHVKRILDEVFKELKDGVSMERGLYVHGLGILRLDKVCGSGGGKKRDV